MKKITTVFIALLMLITSAVGVSAEAEEYEFVDNNVIIVLTEEAGQKVRNGEIEINIDYFSDSNLGIIAVECLDPYSGEMKIYKLELDKNDYENVLSVIEVLKTYEDIEIAEPNYIYSLGGGLPEKMKIKAGKRKEIIPTEISVRKWKSTNKKVATVNKHGWVTALKKGEAKIIAIDSVGKKYTCKVKVTTSPKLVQDGKTVKKLIVKKGCSATVKIKGKAKKIDNKYRSTKLARITSKKSAKKITVQGLKKGNTTLKIKVNGVKTLKLKLRVK